MKTFLNLIILAIITCLMSCTVVTDKNGRVVGTEYDPVARAEADKRQKMAVRDANRQAELNRRAYIESLTQPSGGNGGGYRTPTQQAIYDREVEYQKAQLRALEQQQRPRYLSPAASAMEQARQATYGP